MDPINPWLDPIEVRRLAERLIQPDSSPAPPPEEAGFGARFEGFAESAPLARAAAPVAAPPSEEIRTPEPEARPAVEPAPAAPQEVPPPLPPVEAGANARGPFLGRIQAFRQWMHTNFGASGIFILDREGSVIFDESSHGRLHFLARSLAIASRRPGSSAGNVHVKIGAGATLEVIPVDTPYGCLVLGAVVPEALDAGAVATVMDALTRATSPSRAS
ncbi:MAG: hypothetical protein H7A50_13825 [Akkermansiaceae bacterium]|nr:hypothetical protein [Akkermansiaceae bacterium]